MISSQYISRIVLQRDKVESFGCQQQSGALTTGGSIAEITAAESWMFCEREK